MHLLRRYETSEHLILELDPSDRPAYITSQNDIDKDLRRCGTGYGETYSFDQAGNGKSLALLMDLSSHSREAQSFVDTAQRRCLRPEGALMDFPSRLLVIV